MSILNPSQKNTVGTALFLGIMAGVMSAPEQAYADCRPFYTALAKAKTQQKKKLSHGLMGGAVALRIAGTATFFVLPPLGLALSGAGYAATAGAFAAGRPVSDAQKMRELLAWAYGDELVRSKDYTYSSFLDKKIKRSAYGRAKKDSAHRIEKLLKALKHSPDAPSDWKTMSSTEFEAQVKDLVKRVNEVDLACPRDAKDEGVVVALDGVGQFLERVLRVSKKFPERFSRVDVSSDELMKKVDPSAAFWGDLSIPNSQVVPSLEGETHTLGGDAAAPELVPAPGH